MNWNINSCDGIYNSFDVHFTSKCDNRCPHCIDAQYSGKGIKYPDAHAIAATINKGRRKQVGDAKAEKAKAEREQQRLVEKNVELMEHNDMPQAKADSQERLEVIAKTTQPSTSASPLEQYSDRELADELRRRGWLGDLTKTLNV